MHSEFTFYCPFVSPCPFHRHVPEVALLAQLLAARAGLSLDLPFESISSNDESNLGALVTARRGAEEAQSLLRHVSAPLPHLRARLLLTVGRIRRRLLALTPAEVAWEPPLMASKPPLESSEENEAAAAAAAAARPAKGGKGAGKPDPTAEAAAAEEAAKAAAASAAAKAAQPGPKYLFGLPTTHPVGACAAALLASFQVSASHEGGHDRTLMRDACLELVSLLGSGLVPSCATLHLNLAMAFLVAASDLAKCAKHLVESMPIEADETVFEPGDALPPGTVHELRALASSQSSPSSGDNSGSAPPPIINQTVINLLLAYQREEAADPFGLLTSAKMVGASLHTSLLERCENYRNMCVLPVSHPLLTIKPTAEPPRRAKRRLRESSSNGHDDENNDPNSGNTDDNDEEGAQEEIEEDLPPSAEAAAAAATLGLEANVVCLQWCDCDPTSSGRSDGAENLRAAVQGFLLLGATAEGGGATEINTLSKEGGGEGARAATSSPFASSRRLVPVGPLPVQATRRLQKRAAHFRFALHHAEEDGVADVPAALQRGFELWLCEVYLLLFPDTSNAFVQRGAAKLSDGSPCGATCDLSTLRFLETFLSCKIGGAARCNPNLCAWWRDALEPIADSAAVLMVEMEPGNQAPVA